MTVKARDTAEFSTTHRTAPRAKNRLKFLYQHVDSTEVEKTSFRGTKLLMSGGLQNPSPPISVHVPLHTMEKGSLSLYSRGSC